MSISSGAREGQRPSYPSSFPRSSDVDSSKSPLASRSLERVRGRASRSSGVRWFLRRVWMHWGGVLFRFHFPTAVVSYAEQHKHQFRGDLRWWKWPRKSAFPLGVTITNAESPLFGDNGKNTTRSGVIIGPPFSVQWMDWWVSFLGTDGHWRRN